MKMYIKFILNFYFFPFNYYYFPRLYKLFNQRNLSNIKFLYLTQFCHTLKKWNNNILFFKLKYVRK